MAWSAPATAVAGSVLTAAWLNTYLRDNLLEIRGGGIAIASQAADDIITAASATQLGRATTLPTGVQENITRLGLNAVSQQNAAAQVYQSVRNDSADALSYAALIVNASGNSWAMRMGSAAANSNTLDWVVDALGSPSNRMRLTTDGALSVIGRIESATAQPGFLAYNTANQAITNTPATMEFDTAQYNVGSGFNTTTDTFTAPVTGYYTFSFAGVVTGANSAGGVEVDLVISGTSAQEYRLHDPNLVSNAASLNGRITVHMTAGDTARLEIALHGGATSATLIDYDGTIITHFCGRLEV